MRNEGGFSERDAKIVVTAALGVLCPDGQAQLAHIQEVLAVRLSLEASAAYRDGRAWWPAEQRIRAAIGGRATGHGPDAEVSWPDLPISPYPGGVLGDSRPN